MAMNIRLDARLAAALKEEANRTGDSQQAIIRHAVERLLSERSLRSDRQRALDAGVVEPGEPYRRVPGSVGTDESFSPERSLGIIRYGARR